MGSVQTRAQMLSYDGLNLNVEKLGKVVDENPGEEEAREINFSSTTVF